MHSLATDSHNCFPLSPCQICASRSKDSFQYRCGITLREDEGWSNGVHTTRIQLIELCKSDGKSGLDITAGIARLDCIKLLTSCNNAGLRRSHRSCGFCASLSRDHRRRCSCAARRRRRIHTNTDCARILPAEIGIERLVTIRA